MMAASLKEGDALVDLLLAKGADVNEKSNNDHLDVSVERVTDRDL